MKRRRLILITDAQAGHLRAACRTIAEESGINPRPFEGLQSKADNAVPTDVDKLAVSLDEVLTAALENACGCDAAGTPADEHAHGCDVWLNRAHYRRVDALLSLLRGG